MLDNPIVIPIIADFVFVFIAAPFRDWCSSVEKISV